jgi:hypothetical protein
VIRDLLCHDFRRNEGSTAEAREHERFELDFHDISTIVNLTKYAGRLSLRGGLL